MYMCVTYQETLSLIRMYVCMYIRGVVFSSAFVLLNERNVQHL